MADCPDFCLYIYTGIFCIPVFIVVLTLVTIPAMHYNASLVAINCTYEGSLLDKAPCDVYESGANCWVAKPIFSYCFHGNPHNDTLGTTKAETTRAKALRELDVLIEDTYGDIAPGDNLSCLVDNNGRLGERKIIWFDMMVTIVSGLCSLVSICWCGFFILIAIGSFLSSFCDRKKGENYYELSEL